MKNDDQRKQEGKTIRKFLRWLESGEADNTRRKRPYIIATYRLVTGYQIGDGKEHKLPEEDWIEADELVPVEQTIDDLVERFLAAPSGPSPDPT